MTAPTHRDSRRGFVLAGIGGATAVAFGAFGAHGLEGSIGALADGADRLAWWETAAHYHLAHALALGLTGALSLRATGRALRVAQAMFATGVLVFCGSLYAMSLTGVRWLGAITPIGGTALIAGWIALAIAARALTQRSESTARTELSKS